MRITSCIGHPLNLNILEEHGYPRMDIDAASPEQIARADVSRIELPPATVRYHDGENAPLQVPLWLLQLGGVVACESWREDRVLITSLFTILAAKKDGRTVDDLFFSFGDYRDENGNFLGTRGLGRPIFPEEPQQAGRKLHIPDSVSFRRLVNTCPYPAKLYAQDTPLQVPEDYPAVASLAIPEPSAQLVRNYEPTLNKEWSDRLQVPVYDTEVVGIQNYTPPEEGDLRIVNPGILTALDSELLGAHAMLARTIRSYDGTILGGRALAFMHPDSFGGWRG